MFLMEVRDRAFHVRRFTSVSQSITNLEVIRRQLLLKKTGDATPLVHAMRIGESHRDITILLLGAMSRWVNHLEDADMADKKTKPLLKALRECIYGLEVI